MPSILNIDFTDFSLSFRQIWVYYHADLKKLNDQDVAWMKKKLFSSVPFCETPDPLSAGFFDHYEEQLMSALLGQLKEKVDVTKIRRLLSGPLSSCHQFALALHVYLYTFLRNVLSSRYKSEVADRTLWKLTKFVNSLNNCALPEMDEEEGERLSRVIFRLYGLDLSFDRAGPVNSQKILECSRALQKIPGGSDQKTSPYITYINVCDSFSARAFFLLEYLHLRFGAGT